MLGHAYFEGAGGLAKDVRMALQCYRSAASMSVPEAVEQIIAIEGGEEALRQQCEVTARGEECLGNPSYRRWDAAALDVMRR